MRCPKCGSVLQETNNGNFICTPECGKMIDNQYLYECEQEYNNEIARIKKEIAEKKKALNELYAKKKETHRLLYPKKKNDAGFTYEKACDIARKINRFHFCRDAEQKKSIFFNEIIYIGQKSRHEVYSFDEMMKIIDNVEFILKMYYGTILYDEAKNEFISYYRYIEREGIEGILYENLKFTPYDGEFNYIG